MPENIHSVSELVAQIKQLNELSFPDIWVEGEVSAVSRPASGHLYFVLKDLNTQLRCVLFKQSKLKAACLPEEGEKLLIRGRVSMYAARGELQLVASYVEAAGAGELQREFERLKQKLAAEGLFDTAHKLPIPTLPRRLGVVTSPSGAALQDILRTFATRFPLLDVKLFPSSVQGNDAARELIEAVERAETYHCTSPLDALIIARGGGSPEDLAVFNNEALVRAVHAASMPVVTGIGHEIDFTICDFVSDFRAATPTAAATRCSPDQAELRADITHHSQRLTSLAQRTLETRAQQFDHLQQRILHPRKPLEHLSDKHRQAVKSIHSQALQTLASARLRLSGQKGRITHPRERLNQWRTRHQQLDAGLTQRISDIRQQHATRLATTRSALSAQHLRQIANTHRQASSQWAFRLHRAAGQHLSGHRASLSTTIEKLTLLNPQQTLNRGYALVYDDRRKLITSAYTADKGQTLRTRFADGEVTSTVNERPPAPAPSKK